MQTEEERKLHDELAKKFVEQGKLIEAGWQIMNSLILPKAAGEVQRREMRKAFFMGAQHLYASLIAIMDKDREITEADITKMTAVHEELEKFRWEVTGGR